MAFMADHRADTAQIFASGLIEGQLRNGSGEGDIIEEGVLITVCCRAITLAYTILCNYSNSKTAENKICHVMYCYKRR